ncbi:MAG: molybdopterin converting factor subunit 1 [Alphaproteobacteria bacterium]|nr:molybdopterin converting factor subunit 1 [Alphaproteobacteria bacterium]
MYFAWVKEKVGIGEEQLSPSDEVKTVSDLMEWLKTQSPAHADAFADTSQIRVALDQLHVPFDTTIGEAREIAFFPPVTGGAW